MVKSRAEIQLEYRQRLKQDEAKYEEYLAKARCRKEKNYVPTAELSRKEKAKRNEKNQIYLYRHRQKKQREGQVENVQNAPVENMETSGYETASSIDAPSPLVVNMPFPNRQNGPRKRISRALAKKSNELRNLKGKFESLQMKYKRNMCSIQRLKKKTSNQGNKNGNVSPSAKSAAEQVLKTKGSELVMTQIQTEEIQEITTENRAATGESHQTSFNTSQDTETPECSYQAPEMTPKSKTKRLLKDAGLTRKQQAKVKKQLILGYVIQNQFKKRRMGMKPTQIGAMRSLIGGKILSKYGLKHTINKATGLGRNRLSRYKEGKVKRSREIAKYRSKVMEFLTRDDNSRANPGKADKLKTKGIVHQTRTLTDYLKNLHQKFLSENSHIKLSLASFCRIRPHYIRLTSFISRSCRLCTKHQNMALCARAIKNCGINVSLNPEKFLEEKSDEMINNGLPEKVKFGQWKRVAVEEKGRKKMVMKIVEQELTKNEFIGYLNNQIEEFRGHIGK